MDDIGTKTLETERLILRKFKASDAYAMYEGWCRDERVTQYVTWLPHKRIEETKALVNMWLEAYEKPHTYRYVIVEKAHNKPIGSIDCVGFSLRSESCEIGYCLDANYWGKGLMTEAFKRVIEYLFEEVGINRLFGRYVVSNPGSKKVMEKAGMTFEGFQREAFRLHTGEFVDLGTYSLLKKEYYKLYKGENDE